MESRANLFCDYWDMLSRDVYIYVLKKTNRNDADDIMQDVACIAYAKFHLFTDKEFIDFRRWVFDVASKKIMKWYSRKMRSNKLIPLQDISDNLENIVDELIVYERKETLRVYLTTLSSEEKRLIDLRNVSELSYDQISKITGKSPSSLMTKHTRILKKLLVLIKKHEKDM